MAEHRLIVARGFRIVAWAIGVPALLATIGFGVAAFTAGTGAGAAGGYLDVGTYGIAGLISNAGTGLAQVLGFLSGLAAWMFGLMAVVAAAAAMFAIGLWRVGRGLAAGKGWSRVLAGVVAGWGVLHTLGALLLLQGGARLVDAALLALFLYVLWVVAWRFRPTP